MMERARVHRAVLVAFCGQHLPVDPLVIADVSSPPFGEDEWQAFAKDEADRVARERASDATIGTVTVSSIKPIEVHVLIEVVLKTPEKK